MTLQPPRRRSIFSFSMRGLLVFITVFGCLIGLLAAVLQERQRCQRQIQARMNLFDRRYFYFRTEVKSDDTIPVRSGIWAKVLGNNVLDRIVEIKIETNPYEKTPAILMQGLRYFPNLKTLTMASRAVVRPGFSELVHLHRLERLILDRSYITDAELAAIGGLKRLTYLDLRYTRIGDEGVAHLVNLDQLKTLLLARSKVSDNAAPHLAKIKSLEELNLSFTALSPGAIPELAKLSKLKRLTLSTTRFPPTAQAALRKHLPNCEIEFKE